MAHNNNNNNKHPASELFQSSQHLREQALFAHRQAANDAARTRRVGSALADLAEVDLQLAFRQVREMVAIIGGKSLSERDAETNLMDYPKVLAAE